MESLTPFYRRLSSRFIVLFLLFVGVIGVIFSLFYGQQQAYLNLVQQELPKINQAKNKLGLASKSQQLIIQLRQEQTADLFYKNFQQLLTNLVELNELGSSNNRALSLAITLLQAQQINIERLAENKNRNALLRDNALIQLQLLLDELKVARSELMTRRNKLQQQIIEDKVSDKVTTSRAKAYVNLSERLNQIAATITSTEDIHLLFTRISLVYSLEDFDHYNQQLRQVLASWQPQFSTLEQQLVSDQYLGLLITLEKLLYSEQSVMAKWRGHLRVAQELSLLLTQVAPVVDQYLEPTADLGTQVRTAQPFLAAQIKQLVPALADISSRQLYLALLCLLILSILLFALVLMSVRKLIKRYEHHTQELVEQKLSGDQTIAPYSILQQQLVAAIGQITAPKYSERDYLALTERLNRLEQQLFEQLGLVAFSSEQTKPSKLLQALLFDNADATKHWRHAFDNQALKSLLKSAKQAKASEVTQEQQVVTVLGCSLNCVLQYYGSGECRGVLIKNDKQLALAAKLSELQHSMSLQQQQDAIQLAAYVEHLEKMLVQAMLQNQNVAMGSSESSVQIARQLQRILDWTQQLQVNPQVAEHLTTPKLQNVCLSDEFIAYIHNITLFSGVQRNKVQYRPEPLLIEQGQINSQLFHQLLMKIAKLCLQDKFNSKMLISVSVVDKNSGQQIIQIAFDVSTQGPCQAVESLKALANLTADLPEQSLPVQYLQKLLAVNHASNVQLVERETGFQFSLTMPITLIEDKATTLVEPVGFKEASIVALSDNSELNQQLKQIITTANGKFEALASIEHLTKLLSTTHLKSHPVAVILIAPEHLANDYESIERHLKTLAKPLRPKLFVLQGLCTDKLQKVGLFADSDIIANTDSFSRQLVDFIQSEQPDNLLVRSEVFKAHQYRQTQVEVLIGTEHPAQYFALSYILHWLGLQAHFVCQPEMLLQHWQSGRYLILINKLPVSPFVTLKVANKINRGVFALANDKNIAQQPTLPKEFSHWHTGLIDNIMDIDALINLFTPWLKEAYREKSPDLSPVKASIKQKQSTAKLEAAKRITTSEQPTTDVIKDEQVFDLATYARNQGSPELAVFMLEDYIEDISQASQQLEQSLAVNSSEQAIMALQALKLKCRILSASTLIKLIEQLEVTLQQGKIDDAEGLMPEFKVEQQKLVQYAQAI